MKIKGFLGWSSTGSKMDSQTYAIFCMLVKSRPRRIKSIAFICIKCSQKVIFYIQTIRTKKNPKPFRWEKHSSFLASKFNKRAVTVKNYTCCHKMVKNTIELIMDDHTYLIQYFWTAMTWSCPEGTQSGFTRSQLEHSSSPVGTLNSSQTWKSWMTPAS